MAQQFVLKGVKEIRDYTSTDGTVSFKILNDPRGGSTWQIPQWWARKGNNIVYQSCTVFDVADQYRMIIPTSADTQLQVTYDDDIYNITFSNFDSVERILFTDVTTKRPVLEYLLPSISGGAVAKRIVQAAATIGDFTITGKGDVTVGDTPSYQSNATPAQSLTVVYAWSVTENGVEVDASKAEITAGQGTKAATVDWKAAGDYQVNCTITADASTPAADSPKTGTPKAVSSSIAESVGTVTVSGETDPVAEQSYTYTSSVSGNTVNDLLYKWTVLDGAAHIGQDANPTASISFDEAGNYRVKCTVTSSTISDSDNDTLGVSATQAMTIGDVIVDADADATAGTADNFTASHTGSAPNDILTYAWSVTPDDGTFIISDSDAMSTNITFNAAGTYHVICQISSNQTSDGPATNAPAFDVAVAALTSGFDAVTISSGPTTVNTLNTGKNYNSNLTGGAQPSTLVGTTTFQWTATNVDTGETTSNGCVFSESAGKSATDQNCQVVFTQDGQSYQMRVKYTNLAYEPSTRTGMKTVTIDTSAPDEI